MQNYIVKTLLYDKQVRMFFVDNTQLINNILEMNNGTDKMLKHLLGKTVSAVSLMSGTLEEEQRLSLQITMSNPRYKIFADADSSGNVRGYANDALQTISTDFLSRISIEEFIGQKGSIRVIKGSRMNQFTGITDMPYQNITDDLSHYYIQSEQTQTFIGTNFKLNHDDGILFSNGIFAQLLPGGSHYLLDETKHIFYTNRDLFNELGRYSESILEEKLRKLFNDAKFMGSQSVQFFCGCSKEMFYGIIHTLDQAEIKLAIDKQESIETGCQICGRTYEFNPRELQALL